MDTATFNDEVNLGRIEILGINEISMAYLNGNPVPFEYFGDIKVSVVLNIEL